MHLKFEKAFTVDEANSLLPTLERVLTRIDERMDAVRRAAERLQILDVLWGQEVLAPENPDHAEAEAHRLEIATLMGEIEALVEKEIQGRGLRFPTGGLEHGLIDFPTTWDGRWVFLCWHRGEENIRAWHEIDGGYAGRQEITEAHESGMGISPELD